MEINAKQPAALRDLTNFGELAVRAHAVDDVHLQAMLGAAGWGLLEGDHAWLQVGVLRAAGAGLGDDWERAFEGMLEYAGTQGWVSPDGLTVRAHVERTPAPIALDEADVSWQ
ncbi:hypothetical protein [Paeniglutamicibacter cryotolerans]|uniref:Uncharacterized protein n=1 Tax=Paeniglutamicibacter cryotolerans TaxID=670079 RepID=A0A839QH00_9MICC|nr:hypothetical protein [Paeniglutamicibacter cryotolerans]MBB2995628.1 hypothetical protein [Paeniglutamicibacter cryotolerans]